MKVYREGTRRENKKLVSSIVIRVGFEKDERDELNKMARALKFTSFKDYLYNLVQDSQVHLTNDYNCAIEEGVIHGEEI